MKVATTLSMLSDTYNLSSVVKVYTSSQTVQATEFPANTKLFEVIVFGAGAGGSSAARAGNTSYSTGGTGGGGGGYASFTIPANQVTYPLTITVGSGGTGGAATGPALALPGLTGTNGNSSCFGGNSSCVGSYVTAPGGTAGTPPTSTQAAGTRVAGIGGYTSFLKGGDGVVGDAAGPANAALANCSLYGGGGGGSGGHGSAGTTGLYRGGTGSYIQTGTFGNDGTAASASSGGAGTSRSGTGFAGGGGGGGSGRNTFGSSAYAGGNGGIPGGGAGGGGANVSTSTTAGTLSGKGGDGGRGEVIVIAYY